MEALIVSVLVAVTFLALLGSLFTAIRSSEVNRHRQRMEAALTSYGETLEVVGYQECSISSQPHDFGGDYAAALDGATVGWIDPPGMDLDVLTGVEVMAPDGSWSTNCPAARDNSGFADSGAQRLTIEVESRGQTLTAQVIKTRKPS